MASDQTTRLESTRGESDFRTTHWSMVLTAGRRSSPQSDEALAALCRIYWYPLYVYARRRASDPHEAQDLTQAFFARLLEKNTLAVADPQRGKFRSFLLTCFKNFLANERDKATAAKRGGGMSPIPLDFVWGESQFSREPVEKLTPDRHFDRQWALTLLDHVLETLRTEFRRASKEEHFDQLKAFIGGEDAAISYAEAAQRLGMTPGAAKVAAHRLRRRYRDLLRAEIAQTLADPEEVQEEINRLFAALGS